MTHLQQNCSATTATTTQQKPLTMADLERMAQVLRDIPPEPIGEWMRQKGCPPEQWLVFLPMKLREPRPFGWPDYVKFSALVDSPVFMTRSMYRGMHDPAPPEGRAA